MSQEEKLIKMECLKIANSICQSKGCAYGIEELNAEAELVRQLLVSESEPCGCHSEQNTVPVEKWQHVSRRNNGSEPRNSYPTRL